MKKQLKHVIFTCVLILSLMLSTVLVYAADEETTASNVVVLDSGAIAVEYTDISRYRTNKATYTDKDGASYEYYTSAPTAPEAYADWLFAGWYSDSLCGQANALSSEVTTTESAWAKFVPADILSIKAQISADTFYDSSNAYIRFVTTVDSLDYARVGFDFIVEGESRIGRDSDTVYEYLYAIGKTGKTLNYTPDNIFHAMSKYFVVYSFSNVPNTAFGHGFQVTPYWVTLDGTKVSGELDIKSINQGYTSWMTGVTTEEVGSFAQTSGNSWGTSRVSSQGGCVRGNYYYQAVINRQDAWSLDIDSGISSKYDETKNKVIIQKYDITQGTVVNSSSELTLNHANDITYNEELTYEGDEIISGLLVIAHNGGNNDSENTYNRISFMDPDTLEIVKPTNIQDIQWDSTCVVSDDVNYITVSQDIYAIDYNAIRNQYVVGISNTRTFRIYDSNFKEISGPHSQSSSTGTYVKQGVGSDDGYIYFVYYAENKIEVFDWNGKFVTVIETDIEDALEPENISVYDNKIYIACGNDTNHTTDIYKVSTVTKPDNEAMIQDTEDPEITYYYPTLELAVLEAQEGDTITLIQDNITVNSPMEITANNVTITNQEDKTVTITRGTSLTDNVFENRAINFVITSNETGSVTIDGGNVIGKSIVYNEVDASIKLQNVTVRNFKGNSTVGVSAIATNGKVVLEDSTFSNNSGITGCVLYSESGEVSVANCVFNDNYSTASGGAIRIKDNAQVKLQVENSTFDSNISDNLGGAICFGGGTIDVLDTTFTNNVANGSDGGGALCINFNSIATLRATESYSGVGFKGNSAPKGDGGAIYANRSKVNIEGYTFESNSSKEKGGAIYVWNSASTITSDISVNDVTFKNNVATDGTAIWHQAPSFKIQNSTFETVDSGYAIYQDKGVTLKLSDTSFIGNGKIYLGTNQAATTELSGLLTNVTIVYRDSTGQNVKIGDMPLNQASDITLQPSSNYYVDGTAVLAKGSNANDERLANVAAVVKLATNPSGVTGIWYISDAGNLVSSREGYTVGTGGDYSTLSDALAAEDVTSGTTLYILEDLTLDETVTINKNIILKNHPDNAAEGVTITRGTTDAMFNISSDSILSVRGIITLDGNKADYSGTKSLIVNAGTLSMGQSVTIQNASSTVSGGAVYTSGTLIAEGTTFTNNTSTNVGGAIYIYGGTVQAINGCTFSGNTAAKGGAIGADYQETVTITNGIKNTTFSENGATNYQGGAIYYQALTSGTLVIDSCSFVKNTVATATSSEPAAGGAIWSNRKMTIQGTGSFEENSSAGRGGAIYVTNNNTYNVTGQTFHKNSASEGGAVYVNNGTMTFEGSGTARFSENKATSTSTGGGAICVANSGVANIKNYIFTSNSATYTGGAIRNNGSTAATVTMKINSCEFDSNTGKTGGAIWTNRPLEITGDGLFKNNSATNAHATENGGAVYVAGGAAVKTVKIEGQTFENNSAVNVGSAICNHNNTSSVIMTISDSTFTSAEGVKSAIFTRGNVELSGVSLSGGNKEVELKEETSKVVLAGKITDAVIVYKNASASTIVSKSGIDTASTISLTPVAYTEGIQVLSAEDESEEAMTALANAVTYVTVTPNETSDVWTISAAGILQKEE